MTQQLELKEFLNDYGTSLAEKVIRDFDVVHDPLRDNEIMMDMIMDNLKKKPFPVQREIVKGAVKSFKNGNKSVYIVAEMGSGKTVMAIASAMVLKTNPRVLIVCPPHLVRKWIKEIKETVPVCNVTNLNGKNCLTILETLKCKEQNTKPEFYVIGRERVKSHFQWRPAVISKLNENYCPKCGQILRDNDANPLGIFDKNTHGRFRKKYTCNNKVAVWKWNEDSQTHRKELVLCGEQLWQPDTSSKRYLKYMPALFIANKLKNFFDLLIADEVHQFKNLSGQGYAFGVLSKACKRTLGLTGTLMGGYALDLFYLLYRTHPHLMINDNNRFKNATSFINKYGILEKITVIPEQDGHTVKSKKRTIVKAKPGVSPLLMGKMLLSNTVFLRLSDMSENLPEYTEDVIELEMDELQSEAYMEFEDAMKTALMDAMNHGDYSLLGSYLNALLSYPERIYQGVEVLHPHDKKLVAYGPPVDGIMPKEEKLLEIVNHEVSNGRKVLVYIQNSNTTDISPRLLELLTSEGFRVKVLRSGNTETRSDKIDKWLQQGLDVLICNPKLVETGLDLIEFPSIVFYQCGYNTYTLRQASRRSFRIIQTEPVKVFYMVYLETLQAKAMKLIATKLETSLALEGELTDKGLSALSESAESMSKELAKALLEKIEETGSVRDLWAAYRKKEDAMNVNLDGSSLTSNVNPELLVNQEIINKQPGQISMF